MSRSSFERHGGEKSKAKFKSEKCRNIKVATFLPTRIKILINTYKHIPISSPIWQASNRVPIWEPNS